MKFVVSGRSYSYKASLKSIFNNRFIETSMEIVTATYIKSSPGYKDCPPATLPEYAFIGRSNVGKSSLINMITNKKNLAKTSSTPGKTQLINHFEILSNREKKRKEKWFIVDLPGYGYAKVAQTARNNFDNMIGAYIRKRESLVNLFVLIDSRHEPQQPDIDFINSLGEWQVPFAIIFTKTDKNKPIVTENNVQLFAKALSSSWEISPPVFLSSAINRLGRKEILEYIEGLNASIEGKK